LSPHAPRVSAYVLIDLLSQRSIKGGLRQSRQFFSKLCALHHTSHFLRVSFLFIDFTTVLRFAWFIRASWGVSVDAGVFPPALRTGSYVACGRCGLDRRSTRLNSSH